MEEQFWSSEQLKAPEKIQLSNKEIVNLSDTQFKTLVIRMLQELAGYFNSMKKTQAAMPPAPPSAGFQSLPPIPTIKLGPSSADS